jgi:hypothetical protein
MTCWQQVPTTHSMMQCTLCRQAAPYQPTLLVAKPGFDGNKQQQHMTLLESSLLQASSTGW